MLYKFLNCYIDLKVFIKESLKFFLFVEENVILESSECKALCYFIISSKDWDFYKLIENLSHALSMAIMRYP